MNKHELDEMLAENPFLVLSDVIYQSLYNDTVSYTHLDVYKRQPWGL